MSHPFTVYSTRDRVGVFTNEMDVVLEFVEQVARVVPLEVLDELGAASRRLIELREGYGTPHEVVNAAKELDNARDLVPGFSLSFHLTNDEATVLSHKLLRAVHLFNEVSA